DYDKAAELYVKACEGGDVFGCQNVGTMYFKGEGVKVDLIKGLGYIKIACDKGLWGACSNFALANELIGQKTKSEASFKTAKEYFKKACVFGKNDRSAQVIEEQKKIWLQACEKYETLRKQNY
uniref:tetratricopeptide repeat protein n=1 Tax=uncultured Campylobacter sp. TaxID=218934 RepID=UPI00345D43F1